MINRRGWLILLIGLTFLCNKVYCQQDLDFHLVNQFFSGKNILKVKRDYKDPYLWVLAQNNIVYRINSITQAVDDYTSYFSNYNNVQFTDIAGYSQDTVFVGTNSSTLLELKNGALKTYSTPDGISGNIMQVGVSSPQNVVYYNGLYLPTTLLISTSVTEFQLDVINEKITMANNQYPGVHTLFETTYRNQIYCLTNNPGYYNQTDSAKAILLGMQFATTLYGGDLWYKLHAYGYNINTAYCLKSYFRDNFFYAFGGIYPESYYLNEVYGTEKGLYVNHWDHSTYYPPPYNHYLDGININKVTSIYGLTSFPELIKENLLIGTNQGLYFSNSGYHQYDHNATTYYNSFTLENDIGNKIINDICVNANSYLPRPIPYQDYLGTICEDGAWVATTDGLYLIRPDYTPYTNTTQIQAINFSGQALSDTVMNVCAGSTVSALVNNAYYTGKSIQWYKDGTELSGENSNTLKISDAGSYRALLYDPCQNVHIQSNQLQVNLIAGPQFTFNYPDTLQYCDSTAATLRVTRSPSYHYRWYKNDVLNNDTASSLTVTQTGRYKVEVSACSNSWVPSKEVQVNLQSVTEPGISTDKNIYCQSDSAQLTSTILVDTTAFTLHWYKDNVLLASLNNHFKIHTAAAGTYTLGVTDNKTGCHKVSPGYQLSFTPGPTFTFNYPDKLDYCVNTQVTLSVQGSSNYQYRWYLNDQLLNTTGTYINVTQSGRYKVEVSACPNSWVPSKEVQVNFIQLPIPVITTDKPAYCIGDNATLSLSTTADPSFAVNWYKDNVLLTAYTNQSAITTHEAGTYTAVVSSNPSTSNSQTCTETSNVIPLAFNPPPTLTIEQQVNTTLCEGQNVTLKAMHSAGTVKWSTGETTDAIDVSASGTYSATLTSSSGCTTDASTDVAFLNNPVLSVNDTTICTFLHETVVLSAPAGFVHYNWNHMPGDQTFRVTNPQKVTLTVTDRNGCEATREIRVMQQCPEVFIPNTFTPNGDGVNDVWNIQGLDATAFIQIFNRYGTMIYENRGYSSPWDGSYHQQKLPTGTYYYILKVKSNTHTYSGSVTILY